MTRPKIVSMISGLLLLAVITGPATLSFYEKNAAGGLLLISLIIVLLALNIGIDRLEQFGLGPLSAKLREKIADADQLTEKLKEAIEITLSIAVSGSMRAGRFAEGTHAKERQIKSSVDRIVATAGLSADQHGRIMRDFYRFTDIDMRQALVGSTIHSGDEFESLAKNIRSPATLPADALEKLNRLISLYNSSSDELDRMMNNYKSLVTKGALSDPDAWFDFQQDDRSRGLIRISARSG